MILKYASDHGGWFVWYVCFFLIYICLLMYTCKPNNFSLVFTQMSSTGTSPMSGGPSSSGRGSGKSTNFTLELQSMM